MKGEFVIKGGRTLKALAWVGIVVCALGTLATVTIALVMAKYEVLLVCIATVIVGMILAEYVGLLD